MPIQEVPGRRVRGAALPLAIAALPVGAGVLLLTAATTAQTATRGMVLAPPLAPAGNPVTQEKVNLGRVLFWDEQLSSTRTMACATCHIHGAGGSDPRSQGGGTAALHPGADGAFGTPDDVVGSPGVPLSLADGTYDWNAQYGVLPQVTGRKSPPAINAAYAHELFWDGRAGTTFLDPVTGDTVLAFGAALESQAAGPPTSDVEMAHGGRDWTDIAARVAQSDPLAIAEDVPADLASWMGERGYDELFTEAFGDADITPARIIMAIATYERTLISDEAPIIDHLGGANVLTPAELRGEAVFMAARCDFCHIAPLFTDDSFHNIGVRPSAEDEGRFAITGNPSDRGAVKTPNLLNLELRAPYMRNGRFNTIMQVVNFYNRGGDFNEPNTHPLIQPLGLTPGERADLVAFLSRPMTDPRVANETGPFARPTLFTESDRVPQIFGTATAGAGGFEPAMVALEPALKGNPSFTVAVYSALGGANATLIIDTGEPSPTTPNPGSALMSFNTTLGGVGAGLGWGSVSVAIPDDDALLGRDLFGRWYVADKSAPNGYAVSDAFIAPVFGTRDCVADVTTDGTNPGDADYGFSDGGVTIADLSYFVEQWVAQTPSVADVTTDGSNPGDAGYGVADGAVTVADLSYFVEQWIAGCP
ncbi:MAG: cytochrome c peroxidase [Planctomycetota bacterium]